MTEQMKAPANHAAEALKILEDAWAYFEMPPHPVAPAAPGGYDLPEAA
jgi:hypothetical protein